MWPSMYIRYSRKTASNLHIEIHESLIIKVAKLLTLVNMATSTAKVAWPLMSTLSIYICANSSIGTGLFFLSRSGVSDKFFLVMVQHVILLNQTLQKMAQECVIFGVLVYLWLYNAPSQVSYLGSSLVRLLYPAEDGKSTLSLISSSAGE